MFTSGDLLNLARNLTEVPSGVSYLDTVGKTFARYLGADEAFWADSDYPAQTFTVWRASELKRDRAVEAVMPAMADHPAIRSYVQAPHDITPRRVTDLPDRLWDPIGIEAVHTSAAVMGRRQMGMILTANNAGRGYGWIVTREGSDFTDDALVSASMLLPLLLAIDRLHRLTAPAAAIGADDRFAQLTPRERQTLDLLRTGMTARAIGAVMGISSRTVSKHLEHAYSKLGSHDRLLVSISRP